MGDTKKSTNTGTVQMDEALAASLARLGQAVRARNSGEKATQGKLPLDLDGAAPIDQACAEDRGTCEDGALSEQDVIESGDMLAEHVPFDSLDYLCDAQRVLSEQLVAANRELAATRTGISSWPICSTTP